MFPYPSLVPLVSDSTDNILRDFPALPLVFFQDGTPHHCHGTSCLLEPDLKLGIPLVATLLYITREGGL